MRLQSYNGQFSCILIGTKNNSTTLVTTVASGIVGSSVAIYRSIAQLTLNSPPLDGCTKYTH